MNEQLSVPKMGLLLRNAIKRPWHENKKLQNAIRQFCIKIGEGLNDESISNLLEKEIITLALMAWEGGIGEGMFLLSNVVFFEEGANKFCDEGFFSGFCEQVTTDTFTSNPSACKLISALCSSPEHENRIHIALDNQILQKLICSLQYDSFSETAEAILQICTFHPPSRTTVVSSLLHNTAALRNIITSIDTSSENESFISLLHTLVMSGNLSPLELLLSDSTGDMCSSIIKLSENKDSPLSVKYCLMSWGSHSASLSVKNLPTEVLIKCSPGILTVATVSIPMRKLLLEICSDEVGDDDDDDDDDSEVEESAVLSHLVSNFGKLISSFCSKMTENNKKKRSKTDLRELLLQTLTRLCEHEEVISHIPNSEVSYRSEAGYALSSSVDSEGVKLHQQSSKEFGPLSVTRHHNWLCLRFGEVEQGLSYIGSPKDNDYNNGKSIPHILGYDYIRGMAAASLAYTPLNTKKVSVLCVGLGSGALPIYIYRALHSHLIGNKKKELTLKTFEIEEQVVQAVENVMTGKVFNNKNFVIQTCDALVGLKSEPTASTNSVLIDAYNAVGGIPPHLRTIEFLSEVSRVLCDRGVAVMNLHNGPIGSNDRIESVEYLKRLQKFFPSILLIKLPTQQSNLVAVAIKSKPPLPLLNKVISNSVSVLPGSEFTINNQIEDQKVFGVQPTDPDGMPEGWWGTVG